MVNTMCMKWLAVVGMIFLAAQSYAAEPTALKTEKDKVNYAIGANIVNNLKKQGIEIDLDLVIKGMKDAYSGDKFLLNEEELRIAIEQYQIAVRQKWSQNLAKAAVDNKNAGEAFLNENKKKEGVVVLESGLQYKVIKTSDGKKPTAEDTVEFQYQATLLNGNEFDSTYRGKGPAKFKMNAVVPIGLREALKLMPTGSKWQIFIPSPLAYGERGKSGSAIGPNETLIYEIELLAIK